jgi:hypothetical protein
MLVISVVVQAVELRPGFDNETTDFPRLLANEVL